ncbi:MAG: aldo/keto reductase [Chitinivibrionales bacterium]|nr:aldo/keto reductase [Chitinivibrionales bacterium]
MIYKTYGRTGLKISSFTLGAMRIPYKEDKLSSEECCRQEQNALAVVKRAAKLGINHIDTARGYGNSEILVGKALREIGREKFYLTTKIQAPTTRDDARRHVDEALEKLGVDYIDIIDVHGINNEEKLAAATGAQGCVRGIEDAVKDGVVGFVGCSSHGSSELIRKLIDTDRFAAVSLHYFPTYRRHAEVVDYAYKRDVGILILSPSEKSGKLFAPTPKLSVACAPLHPIMLSHRWTLSHRGVTTLAIGPATPDEFDLHLPAFAHEGPLIENERAAMERWSKAEETALGDTRCTLCFKCLPCPADVAIPEVLRLRNLAKAFGMVEFGKMRYNLLGKGKDWFPGLKGDACTRCGDCLPRCPENLAIPDLLEETHRILEGGQRERLWE